jgi:hypothetical protein
MPYALVPAWLAFACVQHKHKHHRSSKGVDKAEKEALLQQAKQFLEAQLGTEGDASQVVSGKDGGKEGKKEKHKEKHGKGRKDGGGVRPEGVPELTEDDYYARASEFAAWLSEVKHQFFNGK